MEPALKCKHFFTPGERRVPGGESTVPANTRRVATLAPRPITTTPAMAAHPVRRGIVPHGIDTHPCICRYRNCHRIRRTGIRDPLEKQVPRSPSPCPIYLACTGVHRPCHKHIVPMIRISDRSLSTVDHLPPGPWERRNLHGSVLETVSRTLSRA